MSYFEQRLSFLRSAAKFLDLNNNMFEDIQQTCLNYTNDDHQDLTVYSFNLKMDLGLLFEHDADLAFQVMSSPLESAGLFQEVIFHYIDQDSLLPFAVSPSQICVRLRATNMPATQHHFQVRSLPDLTRYSDYPGLVQLRGLVMGISAPTTYTQSTKYVCPDQECEGHHGNYYIRMHVPGASEAETIRPDFWCKFCGQRLDEVKANRVLSEKVLVEVLPVQVCGPLHRLVPREPKAQAVPVFVRDELIGEVSLGKACHVIGVCRTDLVGEEMTLALEANFVQPMEVNKPNTCPSKELVLERVPVLIRRLHEQGGVYPWRFPFLLATTLARDVVPEGMFVQLRLVLLICLVMEPEEFPLHVLSIGGDTVLAQRLMTWSSRYSRRVYRYQSCGGTALSGTVTKHGGDGQCFSQAGCLILSSGGVCLLGDVSLWKKATRNHLQSALTSRQVSLEVPPKLPQPSLPLSCPLSCHVWAVYQPDVAESSSRDLFQGASTGSLPKAFLDSFCYLCLASPPGIGLMEEETAALLVSHCLEPALWKDEDTHLDKEWITKGRGVETVGGRKERGPLWEGTEGQRGKERGDVLVGAGRGGNEIEERGRMSVEEIHNVGHQVYRYAHSGMMPREDNREFTISTGLDTSFNSSTNFDRTHGLYDICSEQNAIHRLPDCTYLDNGFLGNPDDSSDLGLSRTYFREHSEPNGFFGIRGYEEPSKIPEAFRISFSPDLNSSLEIHGCTQDSHEDVGPVREESREGSKKGESKEDDVELTEDDLEQYLGVCKALPVPVLSPASERLLQGFYLASRVARNSNQYGPAVPHNAFDAMRCMSKGVSRLCLRQTVTEIDALVAIFLYEEALTSRHGLSVVNVQPQPHVWSVDSHPWLGRQSDIFVSRLHSRVTDLCSRVVSPVNLFKEE